MTDNSSTHTVVNNNFPIHIVTIETLRQLLQVPQLII